VLKRGMLANLAVASFEHLVQVIRHGLKKAPSTESLWADEDAARTAINPCQPRLPVTGHRRLSGNPIA